MGSGATPRKLRFGYTATRHPRSTFRDGTRIPNTSRAPPREPQNLHTRLPILDLLKVIVNHDPTSGASQTARPLPTSHLTNPLPHPLQLLPPRHKPVPDQRSLRTALSSRHILQQHPQPRPLARAPHPGRTRTPGAGLRARWVVGQVVAPDVPVRVRGARAQAGRPRAPRPPRGPRSSSGSRPRLPSPASCTPSYTQPGPTRLLRGPFCFFALQAAGVAAETLLTRFLGAGEGVWRRLPVEVGRLVRLVYVHVWFYYGAVSGGRFCKGRTVVVQAGPYQSAACAGARC